jgi:signal transduction protein with GAF and PtsI domain
MTTPSPELVGLVTRLGNALGVASRPTTLTDELSRSTAGVRSLFDAAACSCALVESDGAAIRFVAADGIGADAILGTVMPVERGIAGWVAMTGQPLAVADVRVDPRFARDIAEETSYLPTSILAAPILAADGEVLGVIEVLDRTSSSEHSGRDLDVLGLIGAQLASTVRLGSTYDQLGEVLLTALTGASSDAEFAGVLNRLAEGDAHNGLAGLARTFHDLASLGPEGRMFAQTVLNAAVDFSRSRT